MNVCAQMTNQFQMSYSQFSSCLCRLNGVLAVMIENAFNHIEHMPQHQLNETNEQETVSNT